jgi:hypothetical protein
MTSSLKGKGLSNVRSTNARIAVPSGRERTRAELAALLEETGFALERIHTLEIPPKLSEATAR